MKKRKLNILSLASVLVFLVVWEMVSRYKIIDPIYIGTPSKILEQLSIMFADKEFYKSLLNSGESFLFGYFLAVLIGIPMGILLGTQKKIYKIFYPFIALLNAVPYIALLPLFIIWFGVGGAAKTAIVFCMVLAPLVIYTIDSVKTMDKNLVLMARSFEAKDGFILKNLYLYHSLPYIFSGARIGIGRGLIGIVVAELFGLGMGLAYYISFYGSTFQTDKLMAVVVIIVAANFIFMGLLRALQNKVVFW